MESEETLIKHHFRRGIPYSEILLYLNEEGLQMSLITLKRRLKRYGLRRSQAGFDEASVRERVIRLLDGPDSTCGYRHIWHKLRLEGTVVPRNFVQHLLKELDPAGVEARRAPRLARRTYRNSGSNDAWHCDGYDKLKPYGFPIHGCIDGWSRKVLWLTLARTNKCPTYVGKLYINCVKEMGGCPKRLITDLGTENGTIASTQCFFIDNPEGHRYVASPRNQRIESWWAMLRKTWTNWWMGTFKQMQDEDVFDSTSLLHKECLWYCFAPLLQAELQKQKEHWNCHYVRKTRFDTVSGRPDILYRFPHNYGGVQCLQQVPEGKFEDVLAFLPETSVLSQESEDYQSYFRFAQARCGNLSPGTWHECKQLYLTLVNMAA